MDPLEILRGVGVSPRGAAVALPSGVSCDAWRVESDRGPLVVRVERADRPAAEADEPRFEAQAGIVERIAEVDATLAVPRNLDTGRESELGWSVDTLVPGAAVRDVDAPSRAAAAELGRLLAALHALPVEGFGMLEDRRDGLRGSAGSFLEGVLARYAKAWPYSGQPLVAHPVARVAPQLVGALGELREQLERYADSSTIAALHGDLHGGHVFVEEGRLAGVIDFGSAWAGPAAFDLASVAVFMGWAVLEEVLAGYEANSVLRDVRRAEAEQLAVVLALHRLRRAVEERQGAAERWVGFLEELLPRATRRGDT
jgi:aminoglycoside phosphotransferase (APT) family kinase protein